MHYTKLKISSEATSKLRTLKQRTGLTPNLLCRMALMYSLEEGALDNTPLPNEDGSEFNAYTLTGENTNIFISLVYLVENKPDHTLNNKELLDKIRSHIDRGVSSLFIRIKTSSDLISLALKS